MGLISLIVMASFLESWGTEGPYWFEICMFFLFGIVGHYLAAMSFAVSFAGETLILQGCTLFYRFTLFGIGFTRRFKVEEITIENIRESIIGHNPITRFFGLSKPRFRIRKGRKSKVICGDIDRVGASKIAETLRSRN